ncbi:MAG: DUF72 domain-containing protein [Desulfobacteraceae bacterium]
MRGETQIKVGCCGFAASQQEYFKLFKLIEIQNTFYQLPRLQTAEKWRSIAPQGFEFAMKAWQLITHEPSSPTYRRLRGKIDPRRFDRYGRFRATPEILEAWKKTAMFAQTLGATVIVFQCPASLKPTAQNADNMRKFFNSVDRRGFQFAWEPRGKWPDDLVLQLCKELELVHCVDPFKNRPLHGNFQYFRLHGVTGYDYLYTDAELGRLREWAGQKSTYILFNNNYMKGDALRFIDLVQG